MMSWWCHNCSFLWSPIHYCTDATVIKKEREGGREGKREKEREEEREGGRGKEREGERGRGSERERKRKGGGRERVRETERRRERGREREWSNHLHYGADKSNSKLSSNIHFSHNNSNNIITICRAVLNKKKEIILLHAFNQSWFPPTISTLDNQELILTTNYHYHPGMLIAVCSVKCILVPHV